MHRFTPKGSTGTQDILPGDVSGTPVAALIFVGPESRSSIGSASAFIVHRMVGALGQNSSKQWCSYSIIDNTGTLFAVSELNDTYITRHWDRTIGSFVGTATGAFIAGGIRLTWTYAGTPEHNPDYVVILFYGSGTTAHCNTKAIGSAGVNMSGLVPKITFMSSAGDSLNTQKAVHSWAWGVSDGTQVSNPAHGLGESWTLSGNARKHHNIYDLVSGAKTNDISFKLDGQTVPGTMNETVTSGTPPAGLTIGFLAIQWTSGQRVHIAPTNEFYTKYLPQGKVGDWLYTDNKWQAGLGGLMYANQLTYGLSASQGMMGMSVTDGKGMTNQFCWAGDIVGPSDMVGAGFCGYYVYDKTREYNAAYFGQEGFKVNAFDMVTGATSFHPYSVWIIEADDPSGGQGGSPRPHTTDMRLVPRVTVPPVGVAENHVGIITKSHPGGVSAWTEVKTFSFGNSFTQPVRKYFVLYSRLYGHRAAHKKHDLPERRSFVLYTYSDNTTGSPLSGARLKDADGNFLPRSMQWKQRGNMSEANYFWFGEVKFAGNSGNSVTLEASNSFGNISARNPAYFIFNPDTVEPGSYYYDDNGGITPSSSIWHTVCTLDVTDGFGDEWIIMANPSGEYIMGLINVTVSYTLGVSFEARIKVNGQVIGPTIKEVFARGDLNPAEHRLAFIKPPPESLRSGNNTVTLEMRVNQGRATLAGSLVAIRHRAIEGVHNVLNSASGSFTDIIIDQRAVALLHTTGEPLSQLQCRIHGPINSLASTVITDSGISDSLHYGTVMNCANDVTAGSKTYYVAGKSGTTSLSQIFKFLKSRVKTHTTDTRLIPSIPHTTDSKLWGTIKKTHTTDAIILKRATITYTSDARLQKTVMIGKAADALLQKTLAFTYTTDTRLQDERTKFGTTDTRLQQSFIVDRSADALLQQSFTVTRATDTRLQKTLSITHSTDARLQADKTLVYTTDAMLLAARSMTHTTDTMLLVNRALTHSVDTRLQETFTKPYTVDSILQYNWVINRSTDTRLQKTLAIIYTTDIVLQQTYVVARSTDALLMQVSNALHTTDSWLWKTMLVPFQTDTLFEQSYTTTHATDTLIHPAYVKSHTADTVFDRPWARIYTTDSALHGTVRRTYSIDTSIVPADVLPPIGTTECYIGSIINSSAGNIDNWSNPFTFSFDDTFTRLADEYFVIYSRLFGHRAAHKKLHIPDRRCFVLYTYSDNSIGFPLLGSRLRDAQGNILPRSVQYKYRGAASETNYFWFGEVTFLNSMSGAGNSVTLDGWSSSGITSYRSPSYFIFDPATVDPGSYFFDEAIEIIPTDDQWVTICDITVDNGWGDEWTLMANPSGRYISGVIETVLPAEGVSFSARIKVDGVVVGPTTKEVFSADSYPAEHRLTFLMPPPTILPWGNRTVTLEMKAEQGSVALSGALTTIRRRAVEGTYSVMSGSTNTFSDITTGVRAIALLHYDDDALNLLRARVNGTLGPSTSETVVDGYIADSTHYGTTMNSLRNVSAGAQTYRVSSSASKGQSHVFKFLDSKTKWHTTDTKLSPTVEHNTDTALWGTISKTHTTDARLQKTITVAYSTDAKLQFNWILGHTVDTRLQKGGSSTHTTDSWFQKTLVLSYTSDSWLQKTILSTHTTDTRLQKAITLSYNTDALLQQTYSVTYNTDALLQQTYSVTCSVDTMLQFDWTITHSTDTMLQFNATLAHTTDALLQLGWIINHTSDTMIQLDGFIDHATDSWFQKSLSVTHTTDAQLRKTLSVARTTDAWFQKTLTVTCTTDTQLRKTLTTMRTSDTLLQQTYTVISNADTRLQQTYYSSSLTDTLVQQTFTVARTVDTKLQQTKFVTFVSDSLLLAQQSTDHTTDTRLQQTYIQVHTADSWLWKTILTTHTVDTQLQQSFAVTHTVDTKIHPAYVLSHTTDTVTDRPWARTHTTDAQLLGTILASHATDSVLIPRDTVPPVGTTEYKVGETSYIHVGGIYVFSDPIEFLFNQTFTQPGRPCFVLCTYSNSAPGTTFIGGRLKALGMSAFPRSTQFKQAVALPEWNYFWFGEIQFEDRIAGNRLIIEASANGSGKIYKTPSYFIFDPSTVSPGSYYYDDNEEGMDYPSWWVTVCSLTIDNGFSDEWILMANPSGEYLEGIVDVTVDYIVGVRYEARIKVDGVIVGPTIREVFARDGLFPAENRLAAILPKPITLGPGNHTVELEMIAINGRVQCRGALTAIRKRAIEGKHHIMSDASESFSDTTDGLRSIALLHYSDASQDDIRCRINTPISTDASMAIAEHGISDSIHFSTIMNSERNVAAGTQTYYISSSAINGQSHVFKFLPSNLRVHATDAKLTSHPRESTTDTTLWGVIERPHTVDSQLRKTIQMAHTVDTRLQKTLAVARTIDTQLQKTLTTAHTIDAQLQKTLSVDNTTDTQLQLALTVGHVTDAQLQKMFTIAQTVDTQLQKTLFESNTTDTQLQKTIAAVHSVDTQLRKTLIEVQSADTQLLKTLNLPSNTDTLLQKLITTTHVTDSWFWKTIDIVYSTDTMLLLDNMIHTSTDTILQTNWTIPHSADTILQADWVLQHSSDTWFEKTIIRPFNTDSWLQKTLFLAHSTDALMRKTLTRAHATDALLERGVTISQTADTILQLRTTVFHTVDTILQKDAVVIATTDTRLRKSLVVASTVDTRLQAGITSTHVSDTRLQANKTVITTVDTRLQAEGHRVSFTDTLLQLRTAATHNSDTLLLATDQLLSSQSDAMLQADWELFYSLDAMLIGLMEHKHDTDTILFGDGTSLSTTDAALQALDQQIIATTDTRLQTPRELVHSTDTMVQLDGAETYSTDMLLQRRGISLYATDTIISLNRDLSHTVDTALKAENQAVSHTIDAIITGEGILHNITDSLLKALGLVTEYTSDTRLLSSDVAVTQATDTRLLIDGRLAQHSSDALLLALGQSVVHATDTRLMASDRSVVHTTDTLLLEIANKLQFTDTLLKHDGSTPFATDAILMAEKTEVSSVDTMIRGMPVGFGGQENVNFSTSNTTPTVAYTIPKLLFQSGKKYMMFISWTQRSTTSAESVTGDLFFDGNVIPRSEFTNQSPVSTRTNGIYIGELTQPVIPEPIQIRIAYAGTGNAAVLDHVRWFAIELDSLVPSDYVYVENNTPTDVSTPNQAIVSASLDTNEDEWILFYCLNAKETTGSHALVNPSGSGTGVLTRFNFDNSIIVSGSPHRFESPYENRSQSFMLSANPPFTVMGTRSAKLEVTKSTTVANSVSCTGSIFAIRADAIAGAHNFAGAPTSSIPRTLYAPQLVWNVGWNSEDAEVISNGVQLGDPGNEEKIPTTRPFNFDYRSDSYNPGTYNFEYNGVNNDDKRHATFLFAAPPTHEIQHASDTYIAFLSTLGHGSDSLVFQAFAVHSTDTFMFELSIVKGTGTISLGELKGGGVGVVTKYSEKIDPSCLNRRILDRYGWDPTQTPTKTFKNCNIQR